MKKNTKLCFYLYVIGFLYLLNPYIVGILAGTLIISAFGNHMFLLVLGGIALYWYVWAKIRNKFRLYEDMYYWSFIRPFQTVEKEQRSKFGRRKEDKLSEIVFEKFKDHNFIKNFSDEELISIAQLDLPDISDTAQEELHIRRKI